MRTRGSKSLVQATDAISELEGSVGSTVPTLDDGREVNGVKEDMLVASPTLMEIDIPDLANREQPGPSEVEAAHMEETGEEEDTSKLLKDNVNASQVFLEVEAAQMQDIYEEEDTSVLRKDHVDANQIAELERDVTNQNADGEDVSNEIGDTEGDVEAARSGSPSETKVSVERNKVQDENLPMGLPMTRVKRIIKLDPDIRLVSKEAIFAINNTTQQFLECLAEESLSQARKTKRKGVVANDLVLAAKANAIFRDCLGNSLTDFLRSLKQADSSEDNDNEGGDEQQDDEEGSLPKRLEASSAKKKKAPLPPPNNHSMTDFFTHRAVGMNKGESSVAVGGE